MIAANPKGWMQLAGIESTLLILQGENCMKCIDYEIRVRHLDNGLVNAVAAVRTHGRTGTSLTEVQVQCSSGPCTTAELAIRRAEDRTQVFLANRFACQLPQRLPAVQWLQRGNRVMATRFVPQTQIQTLDAG